MENNKELLEAFLDKYENKIVRILSDYISCNKEDYNAYAYNNYGPDDVGLCSYTIKTAQMKFDGTNYLVRLYLDILVDIFSINDLKVSGNYILEASVDSNFDDFQLQDIGLVVECK